MTDAPRPAFVYGTLVEPARVDAILDEWAFDGDAVLEGLQRVEGTYPTLAPGGSTAGRLLVTPELTALDRYEGVERGLYVRVAVPLDGDGEAWVYVGDPDQLDAPARWPGAGSFATRVRHYLDEADVRIRPAANR